MLRSYSKERDSELLSKGHRIEPIVSRRAGTLRECSTEKGDTEKLEFSETDKKRISDTMKWDMAVIHILNSVEASIKWIVDCEGGPIPGPCINLLCQTFQMDSEGSVHAKLSKPQSTKLQKEETIISYSNQTTELAREDKRAEHSISEKD